MYEAFYGLKEKPFNLHPDPEYLYMSEGHEDTYTHLEYAIAESKGFVVVTGEIGSGKTTLLNYLINEIPADMHVGLINNTHIPPSQFIKLICREYELDTENMDKSGMIELFHEFLLEQYSKHKRVILIIDEAQNLSAKTLEEIRLLSNLESEKYYLLQIILVGQPELKYKLQRKDLEQLSQRITVHCHLYGLNEKDVGEYIRYRLEVAGAKQTNIFNSAAIRAIAQHSKGIPRLINILCDTALVYGYADSLKEIGDRIVNDVVKERAAGGIFYEAAKAQDSAASQAPSSTSISNHSIEPESYNGELTVIRERIQLIESRLQHFEAMLSDFSKQHEAILQNKNQRDEIVIDLFKLLKDSMERRLDTLLRVARLER